MVSAAGPRGRKKWRGSEGGCEGKENETGKEDREQLTERGKGRRKDGEDMEAKKERRSYVSRRNIEN